MILFIFRIQHDFINNAKNIRIIGILHNVTNDTSLINAEIVKIIPNKLTHWFLF